MNIKEMIIDMYLKGHSIQYITTCVYRRRNVSYFNNFHKKGIINKEKYYYIQNCRNLVENTILEYSTKGRSPLQTEIQTEQCSVMRGLRLDSFR